jgi:death-on-curing protein
LTIPVDYLTVEELLEIAAGVLPDVLVRDVGLLSSAADRPRTSVFGEDAYPTIESKAAALLHSLARNHPLVDGNKRLAWAGMRTFLILNDADIEYTVDDAEQMVLSVAAGDWDVPDVADWIRTHRA